MNRGFRNQRGGRGFRGGGQFPNYKQRGNVRPPPLLNFFPPANFGFPVPNFNFPRGMNRFPSRLPPLVPNIRMMRGGMPHWRGSSKKQSKKPKNSLTPNANKSRLMEKDVGITEYISGHEGFSGVIKQRFSDFHVNEITTDGSIAKLTDLAPPVDVEHKRPESEIIEILTPEIMEKLKTMVETKMGYVEIEVTEKSKDERRKIHEAIKDGFGKEVYSNTVDRGSKKFITIFKTRKGVMQDRRSRWPADRGGVYVHFILHKENMDTQETVNYLAGKLGVKPNFITYAGTKDRRAMTSQMMSVFKIDPAKLANLSKDLKGVTLGNYSYKPTCLKLGDLKGNRFRISLRNVTGTDQQIEEAVTNLKEKGFINYYGLQRFGTSSSVPTPEVGRALLLGEWKEAIELILKPRNTDEPWAIKRARKHWWVTKDAKRAAKMLRKNFMNIIESKLLYGLSRHAPDDYVGALQNIPRNTRLLYLHSYQSLVWNKIVSRRIKEFGLQPIAGDLVFVDNNDYQEVVDQEGTVVVSDEFPKRPRKKAKKAAALAAREAAARAEAGDTNSAEEKDEDEKETDGTSKSNVDDDIMKDADDTENKGEEEGEAAQKDDSGSSTKAVERSAEENTGAGTAEENVGGTTDDNADEDITEENAGEGPTEENASEGPTEENPEGSKSCALLDYNQKTPAVRAITEEELDSIKIEDIVLPLPGHNVVYPNNVIKQWYEELLAVDGLSFTAMKQNVRQYSVSGTYRRMIVRPENLSWKTMRYSNLLSTLIRSDLDELKNAPEPQDDPEGEYKALILDFCLPSATYATMALREILKVDTSSLHQASLNSYLLGKKAGDKEAPKTDATAEDGETCTSTQNESAKTGEGSTLEVDTNIDIETKQEDSSAGGTKRKADDITEEADGRETDADAVAEAKKVKLEGET